MRASGCSCTLETLWSSLDYYKTAISCIFVNKYHFWLFATIMDVVLMVNLLWGFNFDNLQRNCGEGLTVLRGVIFLVFTVFASIVRILAIFF